MEVIPLFRENQSTRGLAALYSMRLPARSIAAVPVIDIYTRFGQTVSRLLRVSLDISMNKVTSVTLNFHAPTTLNPTSRIPPFYELSPTPFLPFPSKHQNSRHNIGRRSPRIFPPPPLFVSPLFVSPLWTVILITVRIILDWSSRSSADPDISSNPGMEPALILGRSRIFLRPP